MDFCFFEEGFFELAHKLLLMGQNKEFSGGGEIIMIDQPAHGNRLTGPCSHLEQNSRFSLKITADNVKGFRLIRSNRKSA